MSRRNLPSLLLAGTTIFLLASCTTGERPESAPATVAKPRTIAPTELIAEGDRLAATGDLYAAIESYMAARRADPAHPDAAARLGLALADQGRHAEALPHLKDAYLARADDVATTRVLVNALLALERPDEAAARLAPALAQHPDDSRLWNASGIAADMMGDSAAAAAAYRSGLAAAPDNQSLKINLALSLFASGGAQASAAAAAAAGLSMAEVQARANRLIAYRSRAIDRAAGSVTSSLGPVPEAPPMVALALPPVGVEELPPVAAAPATTVAAAPEVDAEPEVPPSPAVSPGEPISVETAPAEMTEPAPAAEASNVVAPTAAAAPEATIEAPTTAVPVPALETAAAAPWGHAGGPQIQIAAYARESLAEAQWARMKSEHAPLLEGLEPVIERAELGPDKGVVYRLRVAVADRGAGLALCDKLRGAGLDCVPVPAL